MTTETQANDNRRRTGHSARAEADDSRAASSESTSAVFELIGERLKQARTGKFTIEQLAKVARVSSGRISQIERGQANPSFDTLWKLAQALEQPMGIFFEGSQQEGNLVVRKDERKRLSIPQSGLEYELLTPDLQGTLEVFRFQVPPWHDNSNAPIVHIGEECIHLLSGELHVHVAGNVHTLFEGDTITYNPGLPHAVANPTPKPALAIAVVTPPSF